MSPAELKRIAGAVGNLKALAVMAGIPYRSLQDYSRGLFGIPEHVAAVVREAHRRDREFMADMVRRLEERLDRDYPRGIPSAPVDID